MSARRFRLFSTPSERPEQPAAPPPVGAATAAARPAEFLASPPAPAAKRDRPPPPGEPHADAPPTDPHGFAPVAPLPAIDPAEASALAAAFAVDFLSWDEQDPGRRRTALRAHLAEPEPEPTRLGWSGGGRQHADLVLAGRQQPDGPGRVLVDVRVRVTPDVPTGAAPATAAAASWRRLSVPVTLRAGRAVVDPWEPAARPSRECLPPAPAPRQRPTPPRRERSAPPPRETSAPPPHEPSAPPPPEPAFMPFTATPFGDEGGAR